MTAGMARFFNPRKANDILGFITGVLTFTPYYHWRWEHALHHATSGDLDRRGTGDVWTLTVQEYLEASRWKRFAYRLARNPFILFGLAPLFLFLIKQRFSSKQGRPGGSGTRCIGRIWRLLAGAGVELAVRPQGVSAAAVDRAVGGRRRLGCGCSMCSISSRAFIGNAARNGITARRPCKAVRSTNCPKCCSGFRATSGFITSII